MPLLNSCKSPGCANLFSAAGPYCKQHARIDRQQKQQKLFEQNKEAKDDHRFYNSAQWKRIRKIKLSSNPLCELCNQEAKIIDHKKRIRSGGDRYSMENLQSLCNQCHQQKRGQESNE
jgi:5-methylcytosine-specific restriction protein A